jgi:peptide/nickel transport system permease protein
MKRLAGRALQSLLLLAATTFGCFLFADLAPGDFYSEMRLDPRISPEAIDQMRAQAGLDRPLAARYGTWAAGAMRGDFGYSLAYRSPVGPLLWQRARATLLLAAAAMLLAWLVGVPLGIWMAVRRGAWLDGVWRVALALLLSLPELLLAIVFLVIAVRSGMFPAGGMTADDFQSLSIWAQAGDMLRRLAVPVSVLALGALPVIARHVRASVAETLDAPFVAAAVAQGIPNRRLLWRHVLPAALNPLVSLFGLSLGALLSGSLLVEIVMGWPGVGPLFVDAVMARDFPIVLAVVTLSTAFLMAGNLVADGLLYLTDPRIGTR